MLERAAVESGDGVPPNLADGSPDVAEGGDGSQIPDHVLAEQEGELADLVAGFDGFPEDESFSSDPDAIEAAAEAAAKAFTSDSEYPTRMISPVTLPSSKTAMVQELDGRAEEAMAAATKSLNPIDLIDSIIMGGLESLDGAAVQSVGDVHRLIAGDRDALLLLIRRCTYGEELELGVTCQRCGHRFDATIDLGTEVPITPLTSDPIFPFTLRHGGQVTLRLATGGDQHKAFANPEAALSERNTVIIARCLMAESWGDRKPEDIVEFVRRMPVADRKGIIDALSERQPGPDYREIEPINCTKCALEIRLFPDVMSMFPV
jgi:hypothetical protein